MTNPSKKSPGRPRSARSHQAMLQATLELLAKVGFETMSIEAIAARAGVGKTTIYRRYSSKAELVADAIESIRKKSSSLIQVVFEMIWMLSFRMQLKSRSIR